MIILNSASDLLNLITTSANSVEVLVSYVDTVTATSVTNGDNQRTVIAAAATTTICAAPAAGTERVVKNISITAKGGANTVTPQFTDGTVAGLVGTVALADEETLTYEDGMGWNVLSSGQIKYVVSTGVAGHLIRVNSVDFAQRTAANFIPTATVVPAGTDDGAGGETELRFDVPANAVTNTIAADMAANSVKANPTAGVADPQDVAFATNTVGLRAGGNFQALAMAASTILTRLATGDIIAGTVAQSLTLLGAFSGVVLRAFTAGGTYTPTSGMKFCIVITTGSGGGGGGADCTAALDAAAGGGGGAGGTCIEAFSAATIGANQTITGGAAGTAGSATNGTTGGAGGNWTFGALHTANGGAGGIGSGLTTIPVSATLGGAGGVPSGGLLNITGGDGGAGMAFISDDVTAANDISIGNGGKGGPSFWGGGGMPGVSASNSAATATQVAGLAGKAFGSGGGGAVALNSTTGAAGGAGLLGCCLVIEFT